MPLQRNFPDRLNTKAAAEYLGVSPDTLRGWCEKRIIRHMRYTKSYAFHRQDLDAFIEARTVESVV